MHIEVGQQGVVEMAYRQPQLVEVDNLAEVGVVHEHRGVPADGVFLRRKSIGEHDTGFFTTEDTEGSEFSCLPGEVFMFTSLTVFAYSNGRCELQAR